MARFTRKYKAEMKLKEMSFIFSQKKKKKRKTRQNKLKGAIITGQVTYGDTF